jgi:hypothetical protein
MRYGSSVKAGLRRFWSALKEYDCIDGARVTGSEKSNEAGQSVATSVPR